MSYRNSKQEQQDVAEMPEFTTLDINSPRAPETQQPPASYDIYTMSKSSGITELCSNRCYDNNIIDDEDSDGELSGAVSSIPAKPKPAYTDSIHVAVSENLNNSSMD